ELALLPPPFVFRRPPAHHVLVLAGLDHLAGDLGTRDRVVAQAARLAVVVHEVVAAGHVLQKVPVADPALPRESLRPFPITVYGLHVGFGPCLFVRLPLLGHGLLSRHFPSAFARNPPGPMPRPTTGAASLGSAAGTPSAGRRPPA